MMPQRLTVLCVDDDTSSLASLAIILRSQDYEVVTASSADEALAACARGQVDGAVVACCLPDSKGTDLAGRIKQIRADIPVILHAALTSPNVDAVLAKPASPEELLKVLREVLARK
jgi:CheY-like chemotaxis protein